MGCTKSHVLAYLFFREIVMQMDVTTNAFGRHHLKYTKSLAPVRATLRTLLTSLRRRLALRQHQPQYLAPFLALAVCQPRDDSDTDERH